jgi:glycosyltransferase involved in cell wall biosynthesis
MYQFEEALRERGFDVTYSDLLPNSYVSRLYESGKRPAADVAFAYARRVAQAPRHREFDLLWIEKELLPWIPGFVEKALLRNSPFILDYDDAVFHNYDQSSSFIVRSMLAGKLPALVSRSSGVLAGNEYLADWARRVGARDVTCVPSVVDPTRYLPLNPPQATELRRYPVIGWIGSPSTTHFLRIIVPTLQRLGRELSFTFVIIGAERPTWFDVPVPVKTCRWSETDEASLLTQIDVGVMPLLDGPWEQGKCGYKLIQYMAASLPAVASSVSANKSIVLDGITGFLCGDEADWERGLRALLQDERLRKEMGKQGRSRVQQHFSLSKAADLIGKAFERVARTGNPAHSQ